MTVPMVILNDISIPSVAMHEVSVTNCFYINKRFYTAFAFSCNVDQS